MNNDQRVSTVFSLVMMLATATLGWITLTNQSVSRLPDIRTAAQVPPDEQHVVARLWEDPLQAVQVEMQKRDPQDKNAESRHTPEALAQAVKQKTSDRKVCFLVVPVPDTPFPDDLEVRLRLRYSVQMALAAENYSPDNRNYLGYLNFTPPQQACEQDLKSNNSAPLPYEWFVPQLTKADARVNVLVLWLPDSLLRRSPIDCLAELHTSLAPKPESPTEPDKLAGIFVVGPRTSDTLLKMVPVEKHLVVGDKKAQPGFGDKSVDDPEHQRRQKALTALRDRLSIFSPQATTPDPLLGLAPHAKWFEARASLVARFRDTFAETAASADKWTYFHNFIAPDDQLTDLLVAELRLRGLKLTGADNDKILVLAEADTAYGQSLPLALQASLDCADHFEFDAQQTGSDTSVKIEEISKQPPDKSQRLLIYRYLRGLDQQKGQQPEVKSPQHASSKSADEALAEALSKESAMALGESQLDYAERLADEIKRGPEAGNIKAVGVLGGDIYDKLILLRSLRSKFPGAVFFTTDLDARLWHTNHLPFTRNMVVASAYGLRVDGDFANAASRIAPFRDGYQVAVFSAVRAALKKAADPSGQVSKPPAPSLYELGRSGPIPLSHSSPESSSRETVSNAENPVRLSVGCLLVGFGVVGFLTFAFASERVKSGSRQDIWQLCHSGNRWICCALFLTVVFAGFYLLVRYLAHQPDGELWTWNEGISIWPTETPRTGRAVRPHHFGVGLGTLRPLSRPVDQRIFL